MIVEGEEEAGSRGFAATVRKHKVGWPSCERLGLTSGLTDM
jgi:hypothetical protein